MSKIRTPIVGAGGVGAYHDRDLIDREDVQPIALCDTNNKSIERLLLDLKMTPDGFDQFSNVNLLLKSTSLDAIIIATPHGHHAGQVRACLSKGVHVLVEKPMDTTAADARDFITCAKEAD